MTAPSPTETLTAAAQRIRERASAAGEGPWAAVPDVMIGGWAVAHKDADPGGPYLADFTRAEHAYWIALMHPGVGLALARVLEQAAEALEGTDVPEDEPVLAVARQLLGEPS